jgi:hypothetical protein
MPMEASIPPTKVAVTDKTVWTTAGQTAHT